MSTNRFFKATRCDRCSTDIARSGYTMSKFNTETICFACKDEEKLAPGYRAADDTETKAVLAGDYNFRGVGLSAEDSAFLVERRKARP